MHYRLAIDATTGMTAGPSSIKVHHRQQSESLSPSSAGPSNDFRQRGRSISNASTSSSLSIISPISSSTNASTSSLKLPFSRQSSRSRSPSPTIDETVRLGPEYVLAMYDYFPQHQNSTCLSFRAGQVIHVFNRDQSGWWDGELEGRRGWFPSNYVHAEITSLTEEEPIAALFNPGHNHGQSSSSAPSWSTVSSRNHISRNANHHHQHNLSMSASSEQDADDPYCPPLMVPLLHGRSLLQTAVRENRVPHFQPFTACIISCVRAILSSTQTLQRDAAILQRFPILAEERRQILTVLANLVSQAKRASEGGLEGHAQEMECQKMLRLGGQVFARVRSFLSVAVKCGVELPEIQASIRTTTPGSTNAQAYIDDEEDAESPSKTPTQHRSRHSTPIVPRPGLRIAGPCSRERPPEPADSPGLAKSLARRQEEYLLRDRGHGRHKSGPSVDSISSSSMSSQESIPTTLPPFPHWPSTASQVMDTLRFTHDHYLSTIAAFIGHAHSHSRTSYASSMGVLYDLVKEIVDMVCKLLTIVEAVMQHPDIPPNRVINLKLAKDGLYNVTSSLAQSVRLLIVPLPPTLSEEAEKQVLLRSATGALKAEADCVSAVKVCLNRSVGDKPFVFNLPHVDSVITHPFTPLKPSTAPSLNPAASSGVTSNGYRLNGMEDEDLTFQAQTPSPISRSREFSSGSETSDMSKSSLVPSEETRATSPDEGQKLAPVIVSRAPVEPDLPSPTSFAQTDDDLVEPLKLLDTSPKFYNTPPTDAEQFENKKKIVSLEPWKSVANLDKALPIVPNPIFVKSIESLTSESSHSSYVTAEEDTSQPELIYLQYLQHRRSFRTSTSSIYSDISNQTVPWSLVSSHLEWFDALGSRLSFALELECDDSRAETSSISTLDSANPSEYSHASSRTLSTDYGLFYTRHALSEVDENFEEDQEEDSLISVY